MKSCKDTVASRDHALPSAHDDSKAEQDTEEAVSLFVYCGMLHVLNTAQSALETSGDAGEVSAAATASTPTEPDNREADEGSFVSAHEHGVSDLFVYSGILYERESVLF